MSQILSNGVIWLIYPGEAYIKDARPQQKQAHVHMDEVVATNTLGQEILFSLHDLRVQVFRVVPSKV